MINRKFAILFFFVFLISFAYDHSCAGTRSPVAVNGTISLSGWDFDTVPVVSLNGTWWFAWHQWQMPDTGVQWSGKPIDTTIAVPRRWNDYPFKVRPIGSRGYATYELVVLLPRHIHSWALHIPEISSAYTLYINGDKKLSVGMPAKEAAAEHPKIASRAADFQTDAERALRTTVKQEKYALVGQVAGKIAHDFNNILGAIVGSSELAMKDCRDDDIRMILK